MLLVDFRESSSRGREEGRDEADFSFSSRSLQRWGLQDVRYFSTMPCSNILLTLTIGPPYRSSINSAAFVQVFKRKRASKVESRLTRFPPPFLSTTVTINQPSLESRSTEGDSISLAWYLVLFPEFADWELPIFLQSGRRW